MLIKMQKKIAENITADDLLPLKQQEVDLIYLLRHVYRYGSVEILVRDGVPNDIMRTVERTRLGQLSTNVFDE